MILNSSHPRKILHCPLNIWLLSFAFRCIAGLGNHQPSGLRRARVSKDERVGRHMGQRRLPRLQLFPKVRSTFLLLFAFFLSVCRRFARPSYKVAKSLKFF